jgi:site-specific recombinase XerD
MGNSLIPSREMKVRASTPDIKVEFFSEDEIDRMRKWIELNYNPERTVKRFRYSERSRYELLFEFLLRTGGRISEILDLTYKDVDTFTETVKMRTMKRKKEVYRTIPLHQDLKKIFSIYSSGRRKYGKDEKIFPMRRQAVDEFLKRMQRDLGFRIHAHKFRHTFAVKAIMDGVPLNVVQKWLGHSSVFTTSVYTDVTGMDTKEWMNRIK